MYLNKYIQPYFLIPLVALLLAVDILLLFAALTDPGYIPKLVDTRKYTARRHAAIPIIPFNASQLQENEIRKSAKIVYNQFILPLKYCYTCNIYRPLRASHCDKCGYCVERFDHHCPYIEVCIGRRNHIFFFMYLFNKVLLMVSVIIIAVWSIVRLSKDDIVGSLALALNRTHSHPWMLYHSFAFG